MTTRTCTLAMMYVRGEMPFVEEWLDYHLHLGIDHVFLGLHVNADLVDPSQYLTLKRPFPQMYDLESSEAALLARLFQLLIPFGDRVTPYVVLRPDQTWRVAQRRFYNAVFGLQRRRFDWVCAHDIDEYLVPQDEYRTIREALAACPDAFDAVHMEQVIVEPRWDGDRRPRRAPLLTPDLRRCAEVVPSFHGVKTFTRCRAAAAIDVHTPELVAGARGLADRRILLYHLRGFPALTEVDSGYRLPMEHQVLDLTDDRPWTLRQEARG